MDPLKHWDEISLDNLDVRCLVGLYPRERVEAQPVRVQIKLYLDTRTAAQECSIAYSIDYRAIAQQVTWILQMGKFKLLETAVEAIASYLLNRSTFEESGTVLEAVQVSIEKPKALAGRASPRIRIFRSKDEYLHRKSSHFHVAYQSKEVVITKTRIEAGTSLMLMTNPLLLVADVPLEAGLQLNGHSWQEGFGVERQNGMHSLLKNTKKHHKSLLTVIRQAGEGMPLSSEFSLYFHFLGSDPQALIN